MLHYPMTHHYGSLQGKLFYSRDEGLHGSIGKEISVIFDISFFYAKTGTQAVVEFFYRVIKAQEQDGGQHLETL